MKKLLLLTIFLPVLVQAINSEPKSFSVYNDTDAYIQLKLYPGNIPAYRDNQGSNLIKPHGYRDFKLKDSKAGKYSQAKSFLILTAMTKPMPKAWFDARESGNEELAERIWKKHEEENSKNKRYIKSDKMKIEDGSLYSVNVENGKFMISNLKS